MVGDQPIAGRSVDVLVILDGASEPSGAGPTSLERARTPVLDRLAAEGVVSPRRTVPPGLTAGSETAIPGLLGWVPDAPVDRGAIEAAAHGIEVGDGERAWRVDRRDRADATATARALAGALAERFPPRRGARVHHLAGHRMLVVAPSGAPTLGGELLGIELQAGLLQAGLPASGLVRCESLGVELLVWPGGAIPPRVLGGDTVVIGACGAAIGIARLMGARTIVPAGATGRPGSDLPAKATAALAAIGGGSGSISESIVSRVVVHVGGADEAAHERDAAAKVAVIEEADALLLAPLADALRERGERWWCAPTTVVTRPPANTTARRCRAWTGRPLTARARPWRRQGHG